VTEFVIRENSTEISYSLPVESSYVPSDEHPGRIKYFGIVEISKLLYKGSSFIGID
jgi:hypothetical protein